MPADVDHFGTFDAYAAVKCWKRLVQQCHDAAYGFGLFNHVDLETHVGQV